MNIRDYFSGVERGLKRRGLVLERPVVSGIVDDYNGFLHFRVSFWDGSQLTVHEVVSTVRGYPEKLRYSYHFRKGSRTIFRYDNSEHHPEIPTHPHHKHHGERIEPSSPPTLADVFAEVETQMADGR